MFNAVSTQKTQCNNIANKSNITVVFANETSTANDIIEANRIVPIRSAAAIPKNRVLWNPSPGLPSASEYLHSKKKPFINDANDWDGDYMQITRNDFIKYFGTKNPKKHIWKEPQELMP